MKLSDNACKYLEQLKRDKDFVLLERSAVIDYMKDQGIAPFEKIVEFQMQYSGLELTIANKPDHTFNAKLFGKSEIEKQQPIDEIKIDGKLYFYCGDHATAQFWFVISEDGEICTYDNQDETVNIIASSFDKFIETYAFRNFLAKEKKYEDPSYYKLINNDGFKTETASFRYHTDESDSFNEWLSNEKLIIYKGTWFDKPSFFIHVYGSDSKTCEDFILSLENKQIIL